MMVGDKYILSGASQLGVTREGKEVKIPPLSVIEKIRDNFADKLKFRIISGNPRQFNYRDESANCAYLHS